VELFITGRHQIGLPGCKITRCASLWRAVFLVKHGLTYAPKCDWVSHSLVCCKEWGRRTVDDTTDRVYPLWGMRWGRRKIWTPTTHYNITHIKGCTPVGEINAWFVLTNDQWMRPCSTTWLLLMWVTMWSIISCANRQ